MREFHALHEVRQSLVGRIDRFGDVRKRGVEDVVCGEEGAREGGDGEFGGFGAFVDYAAVDCLELGAVVQYVFLRGLAGFPGNAESESESESIGGICQERKREERERKRRTEGARARAEQELAHKHKHKHKR